MVKKKRREYLEPTTAEELVEAIERVNRGQFSLDTSRGYFTYGPPWDRSLWNKVPPGERVPGDLEEKVNRKIRRGD